MRIIFRSKHFTLRRNLLKPSAKNIWKTAGKITGLCLLFPGYLIWAAWCFGAICYAPLPGVIRYVCAGVLVILILSAPLMRPRLYFTAGACLVMLVISGLWCLILPSNDRSWAPESARLPEIRWHEDGKSFTVRNIRDFRYRTTLDFDVAYLDRTYSLDDMTGLEYAVVYWEQLLDDEVAHSMLSFRFRNGESLVFSCEARRPIDGQYGAIQDLYKQSGLIYIIGTERDLFGVRTNYREPREQVYLYATNATGEQRTAIFRDLAKRVNALHTEPQFYNTLTSNCITSLIPSIRAGVDIPLFRPAYVLSGFSDHLAYKLGFLTLRYDEETFEELRKRSCINPRVADWNGDPDSYSSLIRKDNISK